MPTRLYFSNNHNYYFHFPHNGSNLHATMPFCLLPIMNTVRTDAVTLFRAQYCTKPHKIDCVTQRVKFIPPFKNSARVLGPEPRDMLQGLSATSQRLFLSGSLSPKWSRACLWLYDLWSGSWRKIPSFLLAQHAPLYGDVSPASLLLPLTNRAKLPGRPLYTCVWCWVSMKGMCRLARLSSPTPS